MKLSEFDFDLPAGLVATRPVRPRPAARMLVAGRTTIEDRVVADLPGILRPGDRLVLNDTKVIPARLNAMRLRQSDQGETRARVEITLLATTPAGSWRALAKPARRLGLGEVLEFGAGLEASVLAKPAGEVELGFNLSGEAFDAALVEVGRMPLPPYIASLRPVDRQDDEDYQTVFASVLGAVAAPTASLHFDEMLLERLRARGVEFTTVTLHVGAGTFLPVKVDDVRKHKMHSEWGRVNAPAADEINATLAARGRVFPVGTTALRLIESAATGAGFVQPFSGETDIFITPGYRFLVASGLMTNFHLPKSTLMMLVAALMGPARIGEIYRHAITQNYRFFSYGDSSLLIP